MDGQEKLRKLVIDDTHYETRFTRKFVQRKMYTPPDPKQVLAYIPGVIRRLDVRAGQRVHRGQPMLVLEAMKMMNTLEAHQDGVIRRVLVAVGLQVSKGQLLVEFE